MNKRRSMRNRTTLSQCEQQGSPPYMMKLRSGMDIVLIAAPIFLFSYGIPPLIGAGPDLSAMLIHLGYLLMMIVGWGVLRMRGSGWRDIAFPRPESWPRTLLAAVATAIGLVILILAVQFVFLNLPWIEIPPVDDSRFDSLAGNLPMLLVLIVLTWTTNAFGEEMFFRAVLINKLGDIFGHSRLGWTLAGMGGAIAFGLVHFQEGPLGIAYTTVMALVLGWIYLRTDCRSLWVPVIAHGLGNTFRFLIVFLGAGSIFLS
jgi:membrane protease YdiL (CAAX protease family)